MNKKQIIEKIIKIAKNYDHHLMNRFDDGSISIFGYKTLEEVSKTKSVEKIIEGFEAIITILDYDEFITTENFCKIDKKIKKYIIQELTKHENIKVRGLALSAIGFAFHNKSERVSFYNEFLKNEENKSLIALCKIEMIMMKLNSMRNLYKT